MITPRILGSRQAHDGPYAYFTAARAATWHGFRRAGPSEHSTPVRIQVSPRPMPMDCAETAVLPSPYLCFSKVQLRQHDDTCPPMRSSGRRESPGVELHSPQRVPLMGHRTAPGGSGSSRVVPSSWRFNSGSLACCVVEMDLANGRLSRLIAPRQDLILAHVAW